MSIDFCGTQVPLVRLGAFNRPLIPAGDRQIVLYCAHWTMPHLEVIPPSSLTAHHREWHL